MSAADYIEITKNFGTIFVTDVPKMGLGQKDMVSVVRCYYISARLTTLQARRFITFIDGTSFIHFSVRVQGVDEPLLQPVMRARYEVTSSVR